MFKRKSTKLAISLLATFTLISTPIIITACSKQASNLQFEDIYSRKTVDLNMLVLHSTYNFQLDNPLVYDDAKKAFNFDDKADQIKQKDYVELINSKVALEQYLENRVVPNLKSPSLSNKIKEYFANLDFEKKTILLLKNVRSDLETTNLNLESGWNVTYAKRHANNFKINLAFNNENKENHRIQKVVSTKTFFIVIDKLRLTQFTHFVLTGIRTTTSSNTN